MDVGIETNLEEVLQTLEEELKKMDPARVASIRRRNRKRNRTRAQMDRNTAAHTRENSADGVTFMNSSKQRHIAHQN